jgi:hypothetical protein
VLVHHSECFGDAFWALLDKTRVLLPCRLITVILQVAEKVRTDERVTVMERANLRYLTRGDLPDQAAVDLVTLDLSFISLLKVLPAVCGMLKASGTLLVLIKPQFEAGREEVSATFVPAALCRVYAHLCLLACTRHLSKPYHFLN